MEKLLNKLLADLVVEYHKLQHFHWYVKGGELFNRIQFQKHKLRNKLDKFDESKSEWQNMQDNGYGRIFDCGNLVFVKIRQT